MPQTRGKIEERIGEIESRLPLKFTWATMEGQPPCEVENIVFWEDRSLSVAKILMRRKGKVYVFTSYPFDPGTNVTILLDQHAWRHATGNSTKVDVGADPITPYSFTWTNVHLFRPSSDVVPVTINMSAGPTSADALIVTDDDGAEQFVMTIDGVGTFSGAPEVARLNVRAFGDGPPLIVEPDVLGTPILWMRTDDCTVLDANPITGGNLPERSTGNSYTAFLDGKAVGSRPVTMRTNTGQFNGHKCIEQPSTLTDLAIGDNLNYDEAGFPTAVNITGDFTFFVCWNSHTASTANNHWFIGVGNATGIVNGISGGTDAGGADARIESDVSGTLHSAQYTTTGAFSTVRTRIAIIRRSGSSTATYYVTADDNNGKPRFLTKNSSGAPNNTTAGRITFNQIFSRGLATNASQASPQGMRMAEFILYNTAFTDAEMQSLYQWGADRFGLELLEASDSLAGGSPSHIFHCYDEDDVRLVTIDDTGMVSIALAADPILTPTIRLQVRDTTEQLRLEFNSTSFCSFTVDTNSQLLIAPAESGSVGIEEISDGFKLHVLASDGNALKLKRDTSNLWTFAIESDGDLVLTPAAGADNVGISTSPSAKLHVLSTTEQLRLAFDSDNHMATTVASDGTTNFNLTGTSPFFRFDDPVHFTNGPTDVTKKAVLDLSSLTTATLRTMFFHDNDSFIGIIRATSLPTLASDRPAWGIKAGGAGVPDEIWVWAKRSDDSWQWNGPLHIME